MSLTTTLHAKRPCPSCGRKVGVNYTETRDYRLSGVELRVLCLPCFLCREYCGADSGYIDVPGSILCPLLFAILEQKSSMSHTECKLVRDTLGLTQKELAERIGGITLFTVEAWEVGAISMEHEDKLRAVARAWLERLKPEELKEAKAAVPHFKGGRGKWSIDLKDA